MSDRSPRADPLAGETPSPSPLASSHGRVELAQFVQSTWPLVKDLYSNRHESAAAEARVFDKIAGMHYVVRCYESAPQDGVMLVCPEECEGLPAPDASYHELWRWADGQEGARFVPFDVKYVRLSAGVYSFKEYEHSHVSAYERLTRHQNASFYIVAFEDEDDHVAIVPRATWLHAVASGYGIEPLTNRIPAWCQPFMVHEDDLHTALGRILRTVEEEGYCFTNPTTGIRLKGWEPATTTRPQLRPSASHMMQQESLDAVLEDWRHIEESGGRILWNDFSPIGCDFLVSFPGVDRLLRVEHKFTTSKMAETVLEIGRRSPFQKRRLWHVLWIRCSDGIICLTRNEVDYKWSQTANATSRGRNAFKLPTDFLEQGHTFSSAAEAHAHVIANAVAAQISLDEALRTLQPSNITQDLNMFFASQHINNAHKRAAEDDPLTGLAKIQISLPWVMRQLNAHCRKYAYGLCLALDPFHPLGDHIFVDHEWSAVDCARYDADQSLPFTVYESQARARSSLILRFQDLTVQPRSPIPCGTVLAMRRMYWIKPVRDRPFFILGSVLNPQVQQSDSQRPSRYLLLPSEFTTMFEQDSFLRKSKLSKRSEGRQVWRKRRQAAIELPNAPKRPRPFASGFLSGEDIVPSRFILSLHDSTIYHQLRKILQSSGMTKIANPQSAFESKSFDASRYIVTVKQVLQAAWDYGYYRRNLRPAKRIRSDFTGWRPYHNDRASTPDDKDLRVLEQAVASTTWRNYIHSLVPELRPERYDNYSDKNIYIVFLRLVLWTEHGLGLPKRVTPPRTVGFLSVFWRRMVRTLLSWLRPELEDAETEMLQRAIESVSAAFARLDHAFDPWTGATVNVNVGRVRQRFRKAGVDDGVAISALNADLFFIALGHLLHKFQHQQHSNTPHGVHFRSMMDGAVEALDCLFEVIRILVTEPAHDEARQLPILPALSPHPIPSASESNAQKCLESLLQWAQNSSLMANLQQLPHLSQTEGQWQVRNEQQDIQGLLVSMGSGRGHVQRSTKQDDGAHNDEAGSVDEECRDSKNDDKEDSGNEGDSEDEKCSEDEEDSDIGGESESGEETDASQDDKTNGDIKADQPQGDEKHDNKSNRYRPNAKDGKGGQERDTTQDDQGNEHNKVDRWQGEKHDSKSNRHRSDASGGGSHLTPYPLAIRTSWEPSQEEEEMAFARIKEAQATALEHQLMHTRVNANDDDETEYDEDEDDSTDTDENDQNEGVDCVDEANDLRASTTAVRAPQDRNAYIPLSNLKPPINIAGLTRYPEEVAQIALAVFHVPRHGPGSEMEGLPDRQRIHDEPYGRLLNRHFHHGVMSTTSVFNKYRGDEKLLPSEWWDHLQTGDRVQQQNRSASIVGATDSDSDIDSVNEPNDIEFLDQDVQNIVHAVYTAPRRGSLIIRSRICEVESLRSHFGSGGYIRKTSPLLAYDGDTRLFPAAWWEIFRAARRENNAQGRAEKKPEQHLKDLLQRGPAPGGSVRTWYADEAHWLLKSYEDHPEIEEHIRVHQHNNSYPLRRRTAKALKEMHLKLSQQGLTSKLLEAAGAFQETGGHAKSSRGRVSESADTHAAGTKKARARRIVIEDSEDDSGAMQHAAASAGGVIKSENRPRTGAHKPRASRIVVEDSEDDAEAIQHARIPIGSYETLGAAPAARQHTRSPFRDSDDSESQEATKTKVGGKKTKARRVLSKPRLRQSELVRGPTDAERNVQVVCNSANCKHTRLDPDPRFVAGEEESVFIVRKLKCPKCGSLTFQKPADGRKTMKWDDLRDRHPAAEVSESAGPTAAPTISTDHTSRIRRESSALDDQEPLAKRRRGATTSSSDAAQAADRQEEYKRLYLERIQNPRRRMQRRGVPASELQEFTARALRGIKTELEERYP
ncbi:hypothetical protein KC349_g8693 [Hortaea werneckii]|nr:hypothetical protein KC349_g8693 [Hortaea werneckii]